MAGESSRLSSSQNSQNGPAKRKRYESAAEMFEAPDPEENERLSRGYRQLMQKADETKADLANKTLKDLRRAVHDGDDLFRTTKATGLASLDAKYLTSTVESAVAMARKMRTSGGTFNIDEFLIRIQGMLGLERRERDDISPVGDDDDDAEARQAARQARKGRLGDWESLGWLAAKHTKRVPGVEFLFGPLAVEHTKRTVQRRARRQSIGAEQRPQEISTQPRPKGQKPAVDDMVANTVLLSKILRARDKGDGINYLEFVINPDDFGQTVENMFYASFLIKEGQAGMQVLDDGTIIIRCEEDDSRTEGAPKNQGIIELDMDTWREAIEVFNIKEPVIPHRNYASTARPEAGAWYT